MRAFWTIVGAVLLAGCSLDTTFEPPVQYVWHGEMVGAPGWENIQGNAALVWTTGRAQFIASIGIQGDQPYELRLWHVHQGTCETGGPMLGFPGDYDDLLINENGTAETDVLIREALNPNRSYYVDIHLSDLSAATTVIACADTVLETDS